MARSRPRPPLLGAIVAAFLVHWPLGTGRAHEGAHNDFHIETWQILIAVGLAALAILIGRMVLARRAKDTTARDEE